MTIRTYSELLQYPTFEDRLRYLSLNGLPCNETFGSNRWVNQNFYKSHEWKILRNHIIARDYGCDLAIPDLYIPGSIYIHHMNPISIDDIANGSDFLMNPEYLVCVSYDTHQRIHYCRSEDISGVYVERTKNDLFPWRQGGM